MVPHTRSDLVTMTQPKRVLLVEDNYDNRQIYSTLLSHVGYEVLQAENGREGLETIARSRPDLILMDLAMPVLDGWATIQILKADPSVSYIPVIAISAHVLVKDAYSNAMRPGFAAYLTKPVEPKGVLEVVRKLIGDPARGSASS